MTDMELFDLRVTVESIVGRSVCGLAVGDWFELVNSSELLEVLSNAKLWSNREYRRLQCG